MIHEFGSDFHYIDSFDDKAIHNPGPNKYRMTIDGRVCFEIIYYHNKLKRIWFPSYFCQEVISSLRNHGLNISIYEHSPENGIDNSISKIKFTPGDGLVTVNYFGKFTRPEYTILPSYVIKIEDHTHAPFSLASFNSDADWCIASLRKTFPIPEGGIFWSPLNHPLPHIPEIESSDISVIQMRLSAMRKKREFLEGMISDKNEYLEIFRETEEKFNDFNPVSATKETVDKILHFNIEKWFSIRNENHKLLRRYLDNLDGVQVFNNYSQDTPFSVILLFNNKLIRDSIRTYLIDNKVYPAKLWDLPDTNGYESKYFSDRMLSIHCDARYSSEDMKKIADIIRIKIAR